jgi:hypothetical protein
MVWVPLSSTAGAFIPYPGRSVENAAPEPLTDNVRAVQRFCIGQNPSGIGLDRVDCFGSRRESHSGRACSLDLHGCERERTPTGSAFVEVRFHSSVLRSSRWSMSFWLARLLSLMGRGFVLALRVRGKPGLASSASLPTNRSCDVIGRNTNVVCSYVAARALRRSSARLPF